jgi:3-polyprenyl-4-hydroxybenzoate decarboxylase
MGGTVGWPGSRALQIISQGRGKRHLQALSPAEAGGQQDVRAGKQGTENERSPLSQCLIRYLYLFSKSLARGAHRSGRFTVHRCYARDPRHLVMFFERRHLWKYYLRAERRNEPLPVACAIGHHCYISIDKRCEGEAKLAAMAAFTGSELIKHVIVVDEDIDVYDEERVLWAVATRVDAATDVAIIDRVKGSRLDPVHPGKDWGSKMIIDACRNEDVNFPGRITTADYPRKI